MRRHFSWLALVVVVALTAAACSSGSGGGKSESTRPAKKVSALKTGPGVTDSAIRLGVITDESGPIQVLAKPLTRGIQAFFDDFNAKGGLGGRKVELEIRDSAYDPQKTVQRYNEIKDSVLFMQQVIGTATTSAVRALLEQDQMLTFAGSLSSDFAHDKYLVLTGTPYRFEMLNAMDYVSKTMKKPKGTKVVAFTQQDEYGQDSLRGIVEGAKFYGFDLVEKLTYRPGDTDFTSQAQALKSSGADLVFVGATPVEAAGFLGAVAQLGLSPTYLADGPALISLLLKVKPALLPLYKKSWKTVTSVAAWGEAVPGMAEMLVGQKKFAPDQAPDYYFMFGWAQAKLGLAILQKALQNGDLTRAGVLKAFESLGKVSFGGLIPDATYGSGPAQRVPSRSTRVFEVTDDPAFPALLKPITQLEVGAAAKKAKI